MSKVSSAPRCTPPMPPVAKISMPASSATYIVAATVVPAAPWRAATAARSRRDALTTPPERRASRSSSSRVRPTLKRPLSDGDRRRRRALAAHRGLEHQRRLEIGGIRHAVGDDRRFERDDGPIARERLGDLGRNVEQRFHVHADRLFPSRTPTPALIAPDYQLCRASIKRVAPRLDRRRLALADLAAAELQAARPNRKRQCSPARSRRDEVIGGALARIGGRGRG